jgi:hypothetical protein
MNCPVAPELAEGEDGEEGEAGEAEGEGGPLLPGAATVDPALPEEMDDGRRPATEGPGLTGDTGASTSGVMEYPEEGTGADPATGSNGEPGEPRPALPRAPGESGDSGGEMERPKGGGERDQVSCEGHGKTTVRG